MFYDLLIPADNTADDLSDDEEDDDFIVDPAAAGSGSSGSNESRGVSHVSVAASLMFVHVAANR